MQERLTAVAAKELEQQQRSRKQLRLWLFGLLALLGFAVFAATLFWLGKTLLPTSSSNEEILTTAPMTAAPELPASSGDGRADFEVLFGHYQDTYREPLQSLAALSWSAARVTAIEKQLEQASELYAREDFNAAHRLIGTTIDQAQALIDEQALNATQLLAKIDQAMSAGSAPGVEQYLRALQSVAPDHPAITQIEQALTVLPQVLELNANIQRFAAENRPEQELEALRKLAEISTLTTTQTQRMQRLEELVAINAVDALLAQARTALAQKDPNQAQSLLEQASRYPHRVDEQQALQTRINALKAELAIARHLQLAQAHREREEWREAEQSFRAVLAIAANHPTAQQGAEQAGSIAELLRKQASLLAQPLRVADANVQTYAQSLVDESASWLTASQRLSQSVTALNTVLTKVRQTKPVRFISDGKATIEIQRVGFIQPTRDKTIELHPGEYKIFTRCSKRFESVSDLLVPLDGDVQPVEVACGAGL